MPFATSNDLNNIVHVWDLIWRYLVIYALGMKYFSSAMHKFMKQTEVYEC
jgi:hypothetical protein